ncbi:secreted protein [Streptococcus pneumoniae]|nr:secreted protein [Streptococcus pneumoniae]
MRRNRGIKKIVIFVLLSVLAFGNTIPYQQFVQKNRQLEVRVQSQKNRMDLMLERQIKE